MVSQRLLVAVGASTLCVRDPVPGERSVHIMHTGHNVAELH